MKALFSLTAMVLLVSLAGLCKVSTDNDCLIYENTKLKEMNIVILQYADSTADTGEFDEFIQSEAGQQYFKLNEEFVESIQSEAGH